MLVKNRDSPESHHVDAARQENNVSITLNAVKQIVKSSNWYLQKLKLVSDVYSLTCPCHLMDTRRHLLEEW